MDGKALVLSILAGLGFGAWPLAMRGSGFHPFVAGFLLNAGSALLFAPFLKGRLSTTTFAGVGLLFAAIAAALNGFGHVAFQQLVARQEIELSTMNIIVLIVILFTISAGGALFYGEPFTWRKTVGVLLGIGAVILLAK
jgi:drug/metabolite transporter (DMT)-like permease